MASSKTYVVEGSVKKSNLQDGGNKWKKGTVTLSQGEDNIWTCTAHIDVNPKSAFIEFKLLRNIVTHSYSFKDGFRVKLKGLTCFDVNNITKQTPSCSIREIRKLMDDAMNGELDSSAFSKITKHLPTSNGDSSSNVRPSNIYASFAPSIGSKNTPIASEHASAKFLKKGQQKSADSKDFIEQQSTRNFYGTNSAPPIASKFLTSKRPALMPYPPESGKRARIASPSTPEQKHATQYSWMSKTTSPFAGSKNLLQGFSNLGNTCYMNAILQALFGLDTFSSDLHDLYTCISERETSVNVELCRSLCCLLNGKHKQNVSLEQQRQSLAKVKQAISTSARRFLGYGQHDAHEFLSQVLDQLKEEIIKFNKGNSTTTLVPSPSSTPSTSSTLSLPPTPSVTAENALTPTGRPNPGKVSLPMKSPSKCLHTDGSCKRHPVTTPDDHQQVNNDDNLLNPISKNFEFGVEHTIYCLRCGDYVKKEESFHDLSLDIPKRRDNTIQSSMQDAVDCFFRREEVEYVCEKCHDNRAEVGHTFTKLPRVLVLHLKRYLFDQRLSTSSKMKKCIKIPSYLSLQLHCTENTQPAHPPTPSTYRYRPVNTMTESTSKTKRKLKFPNSKNAKTEPCELAGSDEEESLLKHSDSKQEANTSDTTTQTEENTEKITSDNDDDLPDLFLEPSQNNASKNLPAYEKEDYCVGGKSEDDMIKMALNASMQDADPQEPTPHATDNSRPESPQWLNARMPRAQSPDIKHSSASKPSLTFVNKPLPSPNGCLTKVSPKKADGARFLSLDRTSKKSPLNEKNGVHQNGRNSASNGITRNMESSTTGKVSPYFDNVQNGDVDNISSCSEADEDVVIVEEKFLTVNKTPGGNRTYMRSKPFFSRKVAQVDGCGDIPTEINECMDVEPHIPYNENISDNQSDDNSIYTNIIQLDGPVESGVQPLTNNDNNEHDAMSFKAARPSKQVISEAVKPKVTTPKAETHRDKAIMVKLLESEQYNTECTEKLLKVKLPELNNDEIVPCSNDSPGDMEALTEMDSMIDLNDSGTIRDGVEMEMCGDDDTLEQQVTEISPDSNKENFEPAVTSVNGDFTEVKPIEPMLAIKENGEIDGPWQNDKKEEDENELQKAIEMSLKEQEISTQQESDDIRKATELSLKDFDDYDETVLPPQEDYIIERSEEEDENIEKNSETGHLPYSYKLVSVVSHLGSASFAGHYVSDVLDMCKGQWSTYDDAHAIPTTENEVRSARTATGYIFFYINKDVYDDLTVIQKARLERAMSGTRLARPTTLPHTAPR